MQINQYPPPNPELVRQNENEQESRHESQPWPHRGLSYPPQVPEQPYHGQGEQGQNVYSGGYIGQSQGMVPPYPPPNDNGQRALGSAQRPRIDWLEGIPGVDALLSEPGRRSLRPTTSEGTVVDPMVPAGHGQRLALEIPSGSMTLGPRQVHMIGNTPGVNQESDRPHRTATMAIRDLIEPIPRDTVDIPFIGSSERRWSAPMATAVNAKQSADGISVTPAFHVTGTESNYLYATARRAQAPATDDATPRPRLLPGHYYYDPKIAPSPSPRTQLQYSAASNSSGEPSEDRHRVEPLASLPFPPGDLYTSGPATFKSETTQLDPDRLLPLGHSPGPHVLLSASVEHHYDAQHELSPHAYPRAHQQQSLPPHIQLSTSGHGYHMREPTEQQSYPNPPWNRSPQGYLHRSQLGHSRPHDHSIPLSASPHSQVYTSDAGSPGTRRDYESSQDQLSPTTTSRSSSIAASQYSPVFTIQPTSSANNLKSIPYYATLRPGPSGSRQARPRTGPELLGNAVQVPSTPSPVLSEAPNPLAISRRRRGSSRPRNPTSARSMPNLLYTSDVGISVTDAASSQRQAVISEEPSQTDVPHLFSGRPSGAHTVGTVTTRECGMDIVMREAPPPPPTSGTIMDAQLKRISGRTTDEKATQISSRGADAWRLHVHQEPPRRAKSVESLGGRVLQYPLNDVRGQLGPIRGSGDRGSSRAPQTFSFSQQELETGMILQEMSTGRMEAATVRENTPQPADLVAPATTGSTSSRHPFVLIDCASALLRYSRSRFFVANGPLMQNNYTELAESINYLGAEMQRIESTFTGQAMHEWISTVSNMEEYKDLERFTRHIGRGHYLALKI